MCRNFEILTLKPRCWTLGPKTRHHLTHILCKNTTCTHKSQTCSVPSTFNIFTVHMALSNVRHQISGTKTSDLIEPYFGQTDSNFSVHITHTQGHCPKKFSTHMYACTIYKYVVCHNFDILTVHISPSDSGCRTSGPDTRLYYTHTRGHTAWRNSSCICLDTQSANM
jgi:hypothetical protein